MIEMPEEGGDCPFSSFFSCVGIDGPGRWGENAGFGVEDVDINH